MKNKTATSVVLALSGGFVVNLLMTIEVILIGNYSDFLTLGLFQAVFPVFAICYKNKSEMQTLLRGVLMFVFAVVIMFAKSFSGFNEWFFPQVCQIVDDDNFGLGILLLGHMVVFIITLVITTLIKIIDCHRKKSE